MVTRETGAKYEFVVKNRWLKQLKWKCNCQVILLRPARQISVDAEGYKVFSPPTRLISGSLRTLSPAIEQTISQRLPLVLPSYINHDHVGRVGLQSGDHLETPAATIVLVPRSFRRGFALQRGQGGH